MEGQDAKQSVPRFQFLVSLTFWKYRSYYCLFALQTPLFMSETLAKRDMINPENREGDMNQVYLVL